MGILILDAHYLFNDGLKLQLNTYESIENIYQLYEGEKIFDFLNKEINIDILLLDLNLDIYKSAIRKATVAQLMTAITIPIIPLDKAVSSILKGVSKDKELIIFPLYGKLLYLFDRLIPAIVRWVGCDSINRFRKLKL